MNDTPRTDAAQREATDDTGAITRMEPIWSTMEALERELNEANADRMRLREALERFLAEIPAMGDIGVVAVKQQAREALTTPPPPVVTKPDADALADAIEYTIKVDAILHPATDHVGMRQALETYRSKYPQ
jgi:hypothetical protein